MASETLAGALEREHREIDAGIEEFTSASDAGAATEPLTKAMQALRRHIYLEEEFLFPPLREAGFMAPIFVMLREHGELWRTLEELDAALEKDPAAQEVRDICARLMQQLDTHNSKEEPILYPQADAVLSEPASARLHTFLAAGNMPDGWVCSGAR